VISIRRFSSYFIDLHRDKPRRTEQGKRFDWSCIWNNIDIAARHFKNFPLRTAEVLQLSLLHEELLGTWSLAKRRDCIWIIPVGRLVWRLHMHAARWCRLHKWCVQPLRAGRKHVFMLQVDCDWNPAFATNDYCCTPFVGLNRRWENIFCNCCILDTCKYIGKYAFSPFLCGFKYILNSFHDNRKIALK